MKSPIEFFDWTRIFFTAEHPTHFMLEVAFRTTILFLFLIVVLKFLSKRGVKQLSIFELAILIALGSASGDPMFYHDVPLFYGFIVLIVVIILYRTIIYFSSKSIWLGKILEGEPVCLLENGKINYAEYKKVRLPADKFFAELRVKSVEQLGQVKKVYLETSGEMSVFYFKADKIFAGLPIYPELLKNPMTESLNTGIYACTTCGEIIHVTIAKEYNCQVCENNNWLPVSKDVSEITTVSG